MATPSKPPALPGDGDHSREDWLQRAAVQFRGMIHQVSGIEVPPLRLSIGYGGRKYERGVAAVCYPRRKDGEGLHQIFISPESGDTADILVSLLHEMIHAALETVDDLKWNQHGGKFAEYCVRLGLTAPYTVSEPDMSMAAEMMVLADELGPFPHAKLSPAVEAVQPDLTTVGGGGTTVVSSAGGPDRNRWLSFYCDIHPSPVRMSAKKAERNALICTEIDEHGICGKPITRR